MEFVKMLLAVVLLAALTAAAPTGLLDIALPNLVERYSKMFPTKEGYHFTLHELDGSTREEMGLILNPGTPEAHLIVVGMHLEYDEKTKTETLTMYTADKNGYRSHFKIQNRKLSITALKSAVHGG